ncbi:MAG: CoA transferase [Dehalococcoidia bacterium]|nr:CoA transferase [Dehalococcoidia bacterium]
MESLLKGIRAVELAAFGNGPIIGIILGDLGAEIIKIEHRITGDPARGISTMYGVNTLSPGGKNMIFEASNRNKKSMTLDLTKEKGRKIVYELIANSDVFYSNYRHNSLKRINMDYETLSKYNPKLIYGAASGFGKKGSDYDKRAFDPIGLARSGIMTASGERNGPPGYTVGAIADTLGATMTAFGIIGGLLARERLGIGQEINTSLIGSLIWTQYTNFEFALMRGQSLARHQRTQAKNPLANTYKCKDDKWIMMGEPQADRFWHQFCQIIGIESLENDERFCDTLKRRDNSEELIKILDGIFATKTREEWLKYLKESGAKFAYDGIYTIEELTEDEQVQANGYIVKNDHPHFGHIKLVQFPIDFSRTPIDPEKKPAPEFGEHTEEVLLDLGYSWDDISRLKDEEII